MSDIVRLDLTTQEAERLAYELNGHTPHLCGGSCLLAVVADKLRAAQANPLNGPTFTFTARCQGCGHVSHPGACATVPLRIEPRDAAIDLADQLRNDEVDEALEKGGEG